MTKLESFVEMYFRLLNHTDPKSLTPALVMVFAPHVKGTSIEKMLEMYNLATQFPAPSPDKDLMGFVKRSEELAELWNKGGRKDLWLLWLEYQLQEKGNKEVKLLRGLEILANKLCKLPNKTAQAIVTKIDNFCETSGVMEDYVR